MISQLFNSVTSDQVSVLLDIVFLIVSVALPGTAAYIVSLKKVKDELVFVLDKSSERNKDLVTLAKTENKLRAVKAIKKLTIKGT